MIRLKCNTFLHHGWVPCRCTRCPLVKIISSQIDLARLAPYKERVQCLQSGEDTCQEPPILYLILLTASALQQFRLP